MSEITTTGTKTPVADTRPGLVDLHEWDELIFGGFYCMHCTPDDADDPDLNVYWPCPPLREAGMTDEEAAEIIRSFRETLNRT